SAWHAEDRQRRFDLSQPPLLRFGWLRLPEERTQLVLTYHHILLDGWSLPLVLEELLTLYRTQGDALSLPKTTPYSTYLGWLQGRDRASAQQAWGDYLSGLEGPTLLARRSASEDQTQSKSSLTLPIELTQALNQQARQQGVTLNTLLQAAWGILLGKLSSSRDVVFGITVAGRPGELPGVERMIGLFINTVPLRLRWRAGETVVELLERLQREQARLLEYQYLDLAEIQRLAGQRQLFDTLCVFENYPVNAKAIVQQDEGFGLRHISGGDRYMTHYPLSVMIEPGERMTLNLIYRPASFDAAKRLGAQLIRLLEAIATVPQSPIDTLPWLDKSERRQLLEEWSGKALDSGEITLAELFEAQATRQPNAVALEGPDGRVSYGELDARANRLASHL
ncbi:MAG: Polyketide synthase modules and related proteins, partial [Candidatus Burkholderia crenata]